MPPTRRSQHAALQDGLDRTPRPTRHAPARRAGEEPAVLDAATAIAVAVAVDVDFDHEPTPRASHRSRQPTQRESGSQQEQARRWERVYKGKEPLREGTQRGEIWRREADSRKRVEERKRREADK